MDYLSHCIDYRLKSYDGLSFKLIIGKTVRVLLHRMFAELYITSLNPRNLE